MQETERKSKAACGKSVSRFIFFGSLLFTNDIHLLV